MATPKKDKNSYVMSVLRVVLGYIFLWAFLDKLFGLGFSTCKDAISGTVKVGCSQAWLHGGSPTAGFLGHATTGPLASFYHNLAGHMWVDWLFMMALLFIGVGLLFGSWIKSASAAGIVLLAMMWSSLLWPVNAPGVDEHIIYILVLFVILFSTTPQKWTVKFPWLKLP